MEETVFTPAAVLDLLYSIDELAGCSIDVVDEPSGTLQISINDTIYDLSNSDMTFVKVDTNAVEDVESVNQETYDEIADESIEPIESGIIKNLIKDIAVGGLVRLTNKIVNS